VSPRLTLKSPLKSLEVLEHPFLEEGAVASDSTGVGVIEKLRDLEAEKTAAKEKYRAEGLQRAKKVLEACPDDSDEQIALVSHATVEEVRLARVRLARSQA
jgi:hypothetical protein